jgi:hypothetical protein
VKQKKASLNYNYGGEGNGKYMEIPNFG